MYVDDMRANFGRMIMCHMVGSDEAELHAMAARIGVARKWYQGDHYDIALSKRAKAVEYGAVEVTWRQLGCMVMLRRRTGQLGNPATAIEDIRAMAKEPKRITPEQYAAAGTEHAHQVALFIWAADNRERWPELARMFAIPNGGERNKAVAARFKAEGVKSGVPDILLPIRRGPWAGLFIELKRPKSSGKAKGRATDEQSDWIAFLHTQGFGAAVCEGWEAARDMIVSYLEYQP